MSETWAEKVQRLQHEIAERQAELSTLVVGDPLVSVSVPIVDPVQNIPRDHRRYDYDKWSPLHLWRDDGRFRGLRG